MWIPALHGIRGVAALLVLVLHAYWTWPLAFSPVVRHLYLSVDLFFILSGIVIALRYADFFQRGSIAGFMRKRFDRLAPVFYVTGLFWLAAFTALVAAKGDAFSLAQTAGAVLRYALAVDVFFTGGETKLNPVAWSIMVEMFAYLLFALLFTVVKARRARIAISAVVAVASFAWLAISTPNLNIVAGSGSLVRCFLGFFVGVLLCLLYQEFPKRGLAVLAACVGAALGALLGLDGPGDLIVFCVLALAMLAIVQWHRRLPPLPRVFNFLGDVSFSLYLWHFVISVVMAKVLARFSDAAGPVFHDGEKFLSLAPMTGLVALAVYVAVSLTVATASYRIIEQKFSVKKKKASAHGGAESLASPAEAP